MGWHDGVMLLKGSQSHAQALAGALSSINPGHLPFTLHFDGSAVPNPGDNCRCGWVVRVIDKEYRDTHFIGKGTNNTAEYWGLIKGMEAALSLNLNVLAVFGDSQLVINAMNKPEKTHKTKPHLQELKEKAMALAQRFDHILFRWVPRELNTHADALTQATASALPQASPSRCHKAPTHGLGKHADPDWPRENASSLWPRPTALQAEACAGRASPLP